MQNFITSFGSIQGTTVRPPFIFTKYCTDSLNVKIAWEHYFLAKNQVVNHCCSVFRQTQLLKQIQIYIDVIDWGGAQVCSASVSMY